MNKKLIIKNTLSEILQTVIFHDQQVMDEFIAMIAVNYPFGKPEHTVEVSPKSTVFHEATEFVEAYEEVIEAVYEIVASEYTVEVVDVTTEVEQEKVNNEALQYLAATDYLIIREMDSGVVCPELVKLARATARARIVR